MTQEDTIRMAREAGLTVCRDEWVFGEMLERFAALVRADERDRAMRENAYVAAEREACAKVCEDMNSVLSPEIAAAIRARGKA